MHRDGDNENGTLFVVLRLGIILWLMFELLFADYSCLAEGSP